MLFWVCISSLVNKQRNISFSLAAKINASAQQLPGRGVIGNISANDLTKLLQNTKKYIVRCDHTITQLLSLHKTGQWGRPEVKCLCRSLWTLGGLLRLKRDEISNHSLCCLIEWTSHSYNYRCRECVATRAKAGSAERHRSDRTFSLFCFFFFRARRPFYIMDL